MTGKTSMHKKQSWANILFVVVFLGIASLFVLPADAQSAQVHVDIPGSNSISDVLPSIDKASGESTETQKEQGLSLADTAVRNALRLAIRVLQFAAVAYIIWIGAEIITHVGNEDLLEKRRPAIAYAIVGFIVLSLGDNALELFNPAKFDQRLGLMEQLTSSKTWELVFNIIDVMRYSMWIVAIVLVVTTGYRMVISQDKDITKPRQQLIWIGIGLFIIQVAKFIVAPFLPANADKIGLGNQLVANFTNILLTFFAPAAFFMFLYGAFVLVTANGDEGKVKTARNILVGTLIAVVLTFSSYAIIAEVIRSFTKT